MDKIEGAVANKAGDREEVTADEVATYIEENEDLVKVALLQPGMAVREAVTGTDHFHLAVDPGDLQDFINVVYEALRERDFFEGR